jgi:hypothetical protein
LLWFSGCNFSGMRECKKLGSFSCSCSYWMGLSCCSCSYWPEFTGRNFCCMGIVKNSIGCG